MGTLRNPIEWSASQLGSASSHVAAINRAIHGTEATEPIIRKIELADLRSAFAAGVDDFETCRSDVMFIGLIYALAGAVLIWVLFHYPLLHLLFPAVTGFALLGPVAAVVLSELSRRLEAGDRAGWISAAKDLGTATFGAIFLFGMALFGIFILWLLAAWGIWNVTLGPHAPATIGEFARQVFFTMDGWLMIIFGAITGFVFALVVLSASVVTVPLLLDRNIGLRRAVATSFRVTMRNPVTILLWGGMIGGALLLGALPVFIGLIIILPVFGHATWHIYRAAIAWPEAAPDAL